MTTRCSVYDAGVTRVAKRHVAKQQRERTGDAAVRFDAERRSVLRQLADSSSLHLIGTWQALMRARARACERHFHDFQERNGRQKKLGFDFHDQKEASVRERGGRERERERERKRERERRKEQGMKGGSRGVSRDSRNTGPLNFPFNFGVHDPRWSPLSGACWRKRLSSA